VLGIRTHWTHLGIGNWTLIIAFICRQRPTAPSFFALTAPRARRGKKNEAKKIKT
jgi:hypothetical protein